MIDIDIGDKPLVLWAYIGTLALTPIMVAVVGFFVTSAIKRREHDLNALQRRREIRKELYDQVGPLLNRIYCYVSDLGDYGHYSPHDIVQAKRDADRVFFTYRTLWSTETRRAYETFMAQAFQTHTGTGVPAKIRAEPLQKVHFFANTGHAWDPAFDAMFTGQADKPAAAAAYEQLVTSFISDMTD